MLSGSCTYTAPWVPPLPHSSPSPACEDRLVAGRKVVKCCSPHLGVQQQREWNFTKAVGTGLVVNFPTTCGCSSRCDGQKTSEEPEFCQAPLVWGLIGTQH